MWAWGSLEADFQRFYHIDLNKAVFQDDMRAKRFYNLVFSLPDDSAFRKFLQDRNKWSMAAFNNEPEI